MARSPNRNWRKRWTVDLSTCSVTHQTGLIVRVKKSDDGGWEGSEGMNINEWFAKDPMNRAKIIARLLREAGEIYKEHLDKRQ